jgi:hypothetical protein
LGFRNDHIVCGVKRLHDVEDRLKKLCFENMDTIIRIKRLVIARHVLFTQKAENEMAAESLTPELIYESILNAPAIFKVLSSSNPSTNKSERLYIIICRHIIKRKKGRVEGHSGVSGFF